MKKFFSSNSPLMKGLTTAADLLILNILTILLCLPVFTIGPAFAALNDIVIRLVRGEEGYTVKPYFHAFAANFKKGLLFSLVLVPAGGILYADYLIAEALIPIMKVGIVAIGLIVMALSFYALALQARYENTFRATWKNAAILAIGNFPKTLAMTVCAIGLWVVCIHFYKLGAPILFLFGFSLPCYVNILLLNGVFRKLDGDDEKEKDEEELPELPYSSYAVFDEDDEADESDAVDDDEDEQDE